MALLQQMVHSLFRASNLACSFCLRVGVRVGVSGGGVDGRGLSVVEGVSVMDSVGVVSCPFCDLPTVGPNVMGVNVMGRWCFQGAIEQKWEMCKAG